MTKATLSELAKINPLIDAGGDTRSVQASLSLMARLLRDSTDGVLELEYEQIHGLSLLLDTCGAALEKMNSPQRQPAIEGGLNHG